MNQGEVSVDPLSALIVDREELDRQRIVEALQGIVGLDRGGEVVQLDKFASLTARQKLIAYLLAYKAAGLLELRSEIAISPTALAATIGLPEGTVYPTISKLRDHRVISQDAQSRYFIAHHQVVAATSSLGLRTRPANQSQSGKTVRRRKTTGQRAKNAATTPRGDVVESPDQGEADSVRQAPVPKVSRNGHADAFKPSDVVRGMIDEGFFNEPRDLASVKVHFKDVLARDIPLTTLSPLFTRLLRSKDLSRQKNSDGKYEYYVPGATT